jgi:hypothetical protein
VQETGGPQGQRPFTVDGVRVTWRRALGKRLVEPGPLDAATRQKVMQTLAGAFRPASKSY